MKASKWGLRHWENQTPAPLSLSTIWPRPRLNWGDSEGGVRCLCRQSLRCLFSSSSRFRWSPGMRRNSASLIESDYSHLVFTRIQRIPQLIVKMQTELLDLVWWITSICYVNRRRVLISDYSNLLSGAASLRDPSLGQSSWKTSGSVFD